MRVRRRGSTSGWWIWVRVRTWRPWPGSKPAIYGSASWRYGGSRLWVPRLVSVRERVPHVPRASVQNGDAAYRLSLDNPGQIGGLQMKTYAPRPLGSHDVEIEVAAAALNFRDVMVTLGLLPSSSFEHSSLGRTVGFEASGIVRRAGADVRTCRVGDAVVFTEGGCIANRAVVKDYLVFRKPDALSMEQAAAVLSVYVTAYYSLIHLARLRKGQRVLIHSAMGGVGQAAIALARHAGAEIYATAGSESKREQLRALGVRAAFDSHSLDWYDELVAATGGEGVDAVLNSLAGRHVALCLEALRPGGWHCEIGKVDIYADNALGLSVFRKNLRFAAIDVDRLMNDDPYLTRELSQQCLDLLEQGAVPPLPITTFPYRDYEEPLRLMTTGGHTGKLVLQAPSADTDTADGPPPVADLRPFLDAEATYLVTGAFGGFGRLLLPYLATAGARHITLLDRDPQRRRSAEWLRRTSALWYLSDEVELDIVAGDVAEEADVRRCVGALERPLKGVFHLAGALDDNLLADLTSESLAKVFAPKARGALNLHHATAGCGLDHFVLFSSIASTLGNPGQVNYSAANGFVDGLAALRRSRGVAGAVLQPRRRGRGRHGRPQPARAAHEPGRRRSADQRRLRHYQSRLRHARHGRPRPPGHRFVLATALDRGLARLPSHRPDPQQPGRVLGGRRRPAHPGRGGGADRRQGGRAVRP